MHTIRHAAACAAAILWATTVSGYSGTIETTHTFAARDGATVVVDATAHRVEVTSRPGTTVEVSVWIEVSGSESKVKNVLNELTPVFEDTGSQLVVRSVRKDGAWTGWGSIRVEGRIEVAMPADMDLQVDVGSGEVTMRGDFGQAELAVDTGSGSVRLDGAARALAVDTGSGSVEADLDRPLEWLSADTGSGGVRLEGGAARVTADTGSGGIRLAGLTGDATLDAGSGGITASWDAVRPGMRVVADTGSGGVELAFPAGTELSGEVSTGSGRIRSDFPATRLDDDDVRFEGGPQAVQVRVDTGSGGAVLRAR